MKKEVKEMEFRIELAKAAIRKFYRLANDPEMYASGECIDAQNECFEILLEYFGWDFEEDHAALQYIPNATDSEIAQWLWDHVLIDFILHEEARKLMEGFDEIYWGVKSCSLDEYLAEIRSAGVIMQQWEVNAFNYLLMQWDPSENSIQGS